MTAGYDSPHCKTTDGYCVPSKIPLCDLQPPAFPAGFNADKQLFLTSTCPSWKSYQEFCNPRKDNPPWWVAFIVIAFLIALVVFIFILCKKKHIKWPARVGDVSLQAKQFCCKNAPEKSTSKTSKVTSTLENTNETFQDDEGNMYSRQNSGHLTSFGNGHLGQSPTRPNEPFYYVLESSNSVCLTPKSRTAFASEGGHGDGDLGRRAAPLGNPTNGVRLPPLTNLNNNGKSVPVGRAAIFNTADGRIQIVDPDHQSTSQGQTISPKPRKKKKVPTATLR